MAHIGNSPASYFTAVTSDVFSANGTATAFTLSKYVSNLADLEIVVNNIQQNPYSGSYSVSNNTLTFSEAPLAGSNNIVVTYRQATIGSTIPTPNTVGNNALQRNLSLTGNTTTQHLVPAANITYDIGTSTMRYRDLYLSGNTISLGDLALSTNGTSFSVMHAQGGMSSSALGNTIITGTLTSNAHTMTGNLTVTGTTSTNGTVTFANSTANTFQILANGNISIGNTSPLAKLPLYTDGSGGSAPSTPILRLEHADVNALGTSGSNGAIISFYNKQRDNTGWPGNTIDGEINFYRSQPTSQAYELNSYIRSQTDGVIGGTTRSTKIVFGTADGTGNASDRIQISSNGNIGVANSTPTNALHVTGRTYSDYVRSPAFELSANAAFNPSGWAGGSGYPSYLWIGGNSRFGFGSSGGVVDVYTDGNYYANEGNSLVWHYSNYPVLLTSGSVSGSFSAGTYADLYTLNGYGTGTFLMQALISTYYGGGETYSELYTGLFCTGSEWVNSGAGETLTTIRGGHSPNAEVFYFRYQRVGQGYARLQWQSSNRNLTLDGTSGKSLEWWVFRLRHIG